MNEDLKYYYIERNQDGTYDIFEGRDELQRRIDVSNTQPEPNMFYGFWHSLEAAEIYSEKLYVGVWV